MSLIIGLAFIGIGLLFLSISWRGSQDLLTPGSLGLSGGSIAKDADSWHRAHRAAAIPLGVTAGCTALGGLAVIVSGWDVIGKSAAGLTLAIVVVGFGISWRTAQRAASA